GIDSQTAAPLIRAMGEVFDFRKAQVGDTFTAKVNDEGLVTAFTYQQSPIDVYEVATAPDGHYDARKKKVPTRVDVAHIGCAIKSSLYESLQRCGEGSQLAAQVIDIFAWDVDFYQDAREGDNLKIIVEKISVDGRFLQYGNIIAAEYSGKFGRSRIFQYADPEGREGYYSADGQSAEKEFLKSPLKYTRVSAAASGEVGIRRGIKKAAPVVYTAAAKT
ncbi:MAG: M23 family peptidase, partial [Myxococcales bacterium]|nr:M23 family peptidase [Myxococcales bacterium]